MKSIVNLKRGLIEIEVHLSLIVRNLHVHLGVLTRLNQHERKLNPRRPRIVSLERLLVASDKRDDGVVLLDEFRELVIGLRGGMKLM